MKRMTESSRFAIVGEGQNARLKRVSLEDHVKHSVRAAILTRRGERPLSDVGGNLYEFLFRPVTSALVSDLRGKIQEMIERAEPRVTVEKVEIESDEEDKSALQISLKYQIKHTEGIRQMKLRVDAQ